MLPHTVLVTVFLFQGLPGFVEVEVPSTAVERVRQEGIWMRKEAEKVEKLKEMQKRELEDLTRRLQEIFDRDRDFKIQEQKFILPPGPARKRKHA